MWTRLIWRRALWLLAKWRTSLLRFQNSQGAWIPREGSFYEINDNWKRNTHIRLLGVGKMYGNCLWFLCVLQDKGYLYALFHAFTLTSYIPVTISKSPVLSCPLSLVQHGLAPHYRQSKNWSHDRKSLPNKRPREYERLGRAVVSHSLCQTPLKMPQQLLSILVSLSTLQLWELKVRIWDKVKPLYYGSGLDESLTSHPETKTNSQNTLHFPNSFASVLPPNFLTAFQMPLAFCLQLVPFCFIIRYSTTLWAKCAVQLVQMEQLYFMKN